MKKLVWIGIGVIVAFIILAFVYMPVVPVPRVTQIMIEPETTLVQYTDLSVFESKVLIDNNPSLTIIDVSPNYEEGHLPGAVNYYVGDGSLDEAIPMLNKNALYLVYCHFESASRAGAQRLVDAGFTNVYRMDGDYSGWVGAGYEVEY